jgi:hypothetical protein
MKLNKARDGPSISWGHKKTTHLTKGLLGLRLIGVNLTPPVQI